MAVNSKSNPDDFQGGVNPYYMGSGFEAISPFGVISSSNFGAVPFTPGGTPSYPSGFPINFAGASPVCICIYPGGMPSNWPQPQPSSSGATQTIDAPRSYWENYLQYLKYQKEIVAKQLEQILNLEQSIQLKMKEMETTADKSEGEKEPQKKSE